MSRHSFARFKFNEKRFRNEDTVQERKKKKKGGKNREVKPDEPPVYANSKKFVENDQYDSIDENDVDSELNKQRFRRLFD